MVGSTAARVGKFAAFLCLLAVITNVFFLFAIHFITQLSDDALAQQDALSNAVATARAAQVSFKNQVHEWKNILIRGQSKEDYDRYLAAFEAQEALTTARLNELADIFQTANLELIPQTLLTQHQQLAALYREALTNYVRGDPRTLFEVDQKIRGIDRNLNLELDRLAEVTEEKANVRLAAFQTESAARYGFFRTTSLILGSLSILFTFGFVFWVVSLHRKSPS
jgi:methyl-accepting chemotaxis protein